MLSTLKTKMLKRLIGTQFRKTALDYFGREDMRGQIQRIDGIRCFSPLGDYAFLKTRLALMSRLGDLHSKTNIGVFSSTRAMFYYGLPAAA